MILFSSPAYLETLIRGCPLGAGEGISAEDAGPNALFKLSALKGSQAAVKVGEAAVPDEEDAAAELESSEDDMAAAASDMDSDEAQRWEFFLLGGSASG